MSPGTIFTVVLYRPWPPPTVVFTSVPTTRDQVFRLAIWPHGGLSVTIEQANEPPLDFASEPVHVHGDGLLLLHSSWSQERGVELRLNNIALRSWSSPSDSPVWIKTTTYDPDGQISFSDASVTQACAAAVARRRVPRPPDRHQQPDDYNVSREEDLATLTQSVNALSEYIEAFRQGNHKHVPAARASIRALSHEQPSHSSYDPLLLRVAAAFDLPLPIYAGPVPALLISDGLTHASSFMISTRREYEALTLMDFQDWLHRQAHWTRTQSRTNTELMTKLSNKFGIPHYDRFIPSDLLQLRQFSVVGVAMIDAIAIEVASVVVSLGKYVITEAKACLASGTR